MSDKIKWLSPGSDKRGGYSGSRPGSAMRPPEKMPSDSIKPTSNGGGKGASDKK